MSCEVCKAKFQRQQLENHDCIEVLMKKLDEKDMTIQTER